MRYLFLIMLWLSTMPHSAEASDEPLKNILKKPVLTQADRDELFRQGLDHPNRSIQQLLLIWDGKAQGQSDLMTARAGWLIGLFMKDFLVAGHRLDAETILKETEELIHRSKLPLSLNEIQFLQLYYRVGGDRNAFFDFKDRLFTLANQIEDPHMRVHALSKMAYELSTREAQHQEIPLLINEVQKILGDPNSVPSPIDAETFGYISNVLIDLGQLSEQEVIKQNLDAICSAKKMRSLCASVFYDFGFDLVTKNDPVAAERAISYFLKTGDSAKQLQDRGLHAYSYYGLNMAYNITKNFKTAILYGEKAANILEELEKPEWTAAALKNLAQSYRLDHQPELALKVAEKALQILPREFKEDLLKIYKELSEVHKVLGHYEEALKYLAMFVDLQKELLTEDASKKYMQLRNQTLSEQNELQAEQIQLLGKFRIVSIVAGGFRCWFVQRSSWSDVRLP